MADASVRLAGPEDAAAIAALSRDLIEHGLPWRWREARVGRAIAAHDANVAVIGPSGAPQAFGIMSYRDDDAHLLLLAVHPAHQRQGLGSAVLVWLEQVARSAGAARIVLEARRSNDAARSFYNEHGYHERAIAPSMYGGAIDGVRLEKWLRPRDASAAG